MIFITLALNCIHLQSNTNMLDSKDVLKSYELSMTTELIRLIRMNANNMHANNWMQIIMYANNQSPNRFAFSA